MGQGEPEGFSLPNGILRTVLFDLTMYGRAFFTMQWYTFVRGRERAYETCQG